MESPDERQQAGRDAKCDGVGQRIQLLAKLAAGVGHAGDASVQRVKGNGEQDGYGRPVQMRLRAAVAADGLDGLGDGKEAGGDVAHGKQRRQQKHAAAQPGLCPGFGQRRIAAVHSPSPFVMAASTLDPPLTRWPTFTRKVAWAGNSTSTLEPNLIRPTRCPRSTVSPWR